MQRQRNDELSYAVSFITTIITCCEFILNLFQDSLHLGNSTGHNVAL